MQTFVVRLNPDPRDGVPYSRYPSEAEYRAIHELSPMDGFHEAVNFLSENGIVRGYLPPKHLRAIRTGDPFALITVTAKTAKTGGNMIVGIQVGCRYEGNNTRSGGTVASRRLKFNWHYSCGESLSLSLENQVPNARELLLGKNESWVRGPTREVKTLALQRILKAVGNSLTSKDERRKFNHISKALRSNLKSIPQIAGDADFELNIIDALKGDLSHVIGKKSPPQIEVRTFQYLRDVKVVAYALKQSKGRCGDCGDRAPFKSSKTGLPYLEVHHIKMLKNGGSDTVDNVIALCPNCHRKRHFG